MLIFHWFRRPGPPLGENQQKEQWSNARGHGKVLRPLRKSSKVKLGLRGYFCLCSQALISLLRFYTACIPKAALYLSRPVWPTDYKHSTQETSKSHHSLDEAPRITFTLILGGGGMIYNILYVCCPSNAEVQAAKAVTVAFRSRDTFQPFLIIKPPVSHLLSAACGPFVSLMRCRRKKKSQNKQAQNLLPQGLSISPVTRQGHLLFISLLQQCSPSLSVCVLNTNMLLRISLCQ